MAQLPTVQLHECQDVCCGCSTHRKGRSTCLPFDQASASIPLPDPSNSRGTQHQLGHHGCPEYGVPASEMCQCDMALERVCECLFFICYYGLCAFAKGWHKPAANSKELLMTCFEFPFMQKEKAGMTGASLKSVFLNISVDT